MKRQSLGHFLNTPKANLPRSTFNRSSSYKSSFHFSQVCPVYCEEVLPGDTVDMRVSNFMRMMPTVTPFMDNAYVDMHWFFVPNRLVWNNWERFNGQQDDPDDSTDFVIPQMPLVPAANGIQSIPDYFGIQQGSTVNVNALPFRAYNLIWNEWFRDQNIDDARVVDKDDGPDDPMAYYLPGHRNKFHDYFTTCLPFPQKGPSVHIPVDGLPISGLGAAAQTFPSVGLTAYETDATAGTVYAAARSSNSVSILMEQDPNNAGFPNVRVHVPTDSTIATINSLRQAEAIQSLLERDARGGTRYTEMIRAHFGVISPDARLQRPEYLGGNSVRISQTPVLQTSETGTTPQGNLAGMGTLNSHDCRFIKSFTEHGYIIGVCSARSDLHYQQGADRHWFRETRYDYYIPALANLGEQAVLNKELRISNTSVDDEVFGYQERWAEYKYKPSRVSGYLNSNAGALSLDVWHLAEDFGVAQPTLDTTFIADGTPYDRVLAVSTNAPALIGDFYFDTKWTRVMPTYSIPGMGARF